MRQIVAGKIADTVCQMCISANYYIDPQVIECIEKARKSETSPLGKKILEMMLENYRLAAEKQMPICQDTGVAVVFAEVGQDVKILGGTLEEAINDGIRRGYKEGFLRKSMVADPLFDRKNTTDNTPAIIHLRLVAGNSLKLIVAPKGGGSENMSTIAMMKPADGVEGVTDFVLKTVKNAGGNPCPPIIVGVGIGGNFEQCALLAKRALLRPLNDVHPDESYGNLEKELLEKINQLNVGPQGFGGKTTALAVKIEHMPCHIASLPVAVNIQCHVHRHLEKTL
ncbi:MAG: fumarate hydratase [Candidatus Cloacimonetes bacterium]|nr:fumarate hydratase [Candidatus Cloacimonadota bacterium]